MSESMRLSGQRNQCRGCSEFFASNFAFDQHRTGRFGIDRRCRSVEEMLERGMAKNAGGWWISKANPQWGRTQKDMGEE